MIERHTSANRAYLAVANAFAQICSANATQTSDTLGTLYAIADNGIGGYEP